MATFKVGENVIDLTTGQQFRVDDGDMELDPSKYGRTTPGFQTRDPKQAVRNAAALPKDDGHEFLSKAEDRNANAALALPKENRVGGETVQSTRPFLKEQQRANIVLPAQMLGTGGGAALGGLAGMPHIGAIAGSMGTEALLQGVGLQPKSTENLLVSGAVPAGVGVGSKIASKVGRMIPGVKDVIKGDMINRLPGVGKSLQPKEDPSVLYKNAEELGGQIRVKTPQTETLLGELDTQASKGFKDSLSGIRGRMNEVTEMVTRPGGVPGDELMVKISQMGEKLDSLERRGGLGLGAAKRMRGAMMDDLDALGNSIQGGEAAEVFGQARNAFKRQQAARQVDEMIFGHEKTTKTGVIDIDGAKVMDSMRKLSDPRSKTYDKHFVAGMGKDLPEMEKFFGELNKLGPIGIEMGPGGLATRGILAGIGGHAVGGPFGAAAGIAGAKSPEMFAKVVNSPIGRAVVLSAVKAANTKTITQPILHMAMRFMDSNKFSAENK